MDSLLYLFMHSLVDSHLCLDHRSNPQSPPIGMTLRSTEQPGQGQEWFLSGCKSTSPALAAGRPHRGRAVCGLDILDSPDTATAGILRRVPGDRGGLQVPACTELAVAAPARK